MMSRFSQWIVLVVGMLVSTSLAYAQGGPTFYPKPASLPPVQETPVGREILGGLPPEPVSDGRFDAYPYGYEPAPGPGLSPMLLSGDPITVLPHAIDLANRYGIVQCIAVLLVIFIFQYVRNAQKSANRREEFFRNQLDYSDKRTTEELTRLSSKLGMMEQDLRAMQDRFDRHGELIRASGQLCREIVSTMTAHNLAVEQGINELGAKLDALTTAVRKKIKSKGEGDPR